MDMIDEYHPDTRVVIHWTSSQGFKFSVTTRVSDFRDCLVEVFESTIIDNVENIYYTVNNTTKVLDYYNTII